MRTADWVKALWSFTVLGAIIAFIYTGHPVAAFLFIFLFPSSGK